jgi:hypothetical protein
VPAGWPAVAAQHICKAFGRCQAAPLWGWLNGSAVRAGFLAFAWISLFRLDFSFSQGWQLLITATAPGVGMMPGRIRI